MSAQTSIAEQTIVVVMAAGKGTRMGRTDMGKVCFEIDGTPAINRLIATFAKRRLSQVMLVVGTKAEQVMKTVAQAHAGIFCVFQHPQLGTGHAARVAAEAIEAIDWNGYVLVTAGDKLIEPEAIDALLAGFVKQQADMALLVLPPGTENPGSVGRVVVDDDGQALGIIEHIDLARQAIADALREELKADKPIDSAEIRVLIDRQIADHEKQESAVGDLLALLANQDRPDRAALDALLSTDAYDLRVDGRRLTAKQIEKRCQGVNPSMYLFRADVFYRGVALIDNNNAQGEYYITDLVGALATERNTEGDRQYRVRAVPVDNADWVQGFNSPDELLAIQDYVRRQRIRRGRSGQANVRPQLKPSQFVTPRRWLAKLDSDPPSIRRWLTRIYGEHHDLHAEKKKDLRRVLECYAKHFGADEKVCVVRAPGRVNLMGRHIDHRGGLTNFLAIDRETVAVAGLRDDNNVRAVNVEPRRFPAVEFNISELIGRFAWSDWHNYVNSDWVRQLLISARGDWGNYLKAAIVRLQHRFHDVQIHGLNLAITGNVPIAAGLSSSSTLVVAALQAAIALGGFELTSRQFIDLCGEGEWFVGSRGGAGDHAAIYLGQRAKVAHVGYLPFRVEKIVDAPDDYQVIIANSHIKAAKSSGAKDTFNARIADYNLGLALLKQRSSEISASVEYVRDLNPEKIGCRVSDIYRMLLKLPERLSRADYCSLLSAEHRDLIESSFAMHAEPDHYNPRGVLLFGAAEVLRSARCIHLIESGQIDSLGQLMQVSHDGDRVSRSGADGKYATTDDICKDAYLHGLIADLASEEPDRVLRAQLHQQPGRYACSTPEIDQMVDLTSQVPGVAGAQIAGAGLGGCIMILARKEAVGAVRKKLVRDYYRPRKLKPAILPCVNSDGAGLVEF